MKASDGTSPGNIEKMQPISRQAEPQVMGDEISLMKYVEIAVRRWWIILGIALVIIAVSYLYSLNQPKEFVYTFSIVYQGKNHDLNLTGLDMLQTKSFDKNLWLNVMKSKLIMQMVSNAMRVRHSPESLLNMLKIEQKREIDNIFYVTLTTPDKTIIPSYSHALVNALNDYERRLVSANADSLIRVLSVQSIDNDMELNTINAEIKSYYMQNNLLDAQDVENKLTQLNLYRSDLTTSIVELNSIRASLKAIEVKLGVKEADIASLMTNIDPLMSQLSNLEVELATEQTRYSSKHPKIVAIQNNIRNIKDLMAKGMAGSDSLDGFTNNRMQQNLTQQYITLSIQQIEYETKIASWNKEIAEMYKSVSSIIGSDDRLQELLRKKQLLEQANLDIQKSKLETQSNNIVHIDNFLMLDEPNYPTAPTTKTKMILLIGIILGLGLGFAFALIAETVTDKIYSADGLESIAHCPVLCSLPILKTKLKSVLYDDVAIKEYMLPYTILKVKLKVLYVKNRCNFLTVVSPEKQEGKTTTCISLALALANDGFKVLLADADLWSPSLTNAFHLDGKHGLSDFLKDHRRSIEEIIYPSHIDNLQILPAGTELDEIGNILRPKTINELQNEISQMFDWVIMDTPALLLVPDSYEFIKFSPIILMVIRMNHTKKVDFKDMVAHLDMAQIKLTGLVLNGLKSSFLSKYYKPSYTFRYKYYNKYNKLHRKDYEKNKNDF